jgi:hypothetical protein
MLAPDLSKLFTHYLWNDIEDFDQIDRMSTIIEKLSIGPFTVLLESALYVCEIRP